MAVRVNSEVKPTDSEGHSQPYLRGRKDMRSESFQYLFDLFFLFWFLRFFERHLKKEVEDENE